MRWTDSAKPGTQTSPSLGSRGNSVDGQGHHAEHLHHNRKRGPAFCASHSVSACSTCRDRPAAQSSPQNGSASSAFQANEEESDDDMDTSFLEVAALKGKTFESEQDREASMCEDLAKNLRRRPTLPAHPDDASKSWEDLETGIALPKVSCSFAGCLWHGEAEAALRVHLLRDHASALRRACGDEEGLWFDVYLGAIASIERNQIPAVGLSKDRQMLKKLRRHYNDESICSLICVVCGQIKTKTPGETSHIDWQRDGWFASLPNASNTLDAN